MPASSHDPRRGLGRAPRSRPASMFGGGGIGALFGGKKPRDGAGASSPASGRARASPGVGANPGTAASPNRHRFGPASPPSGASPGREIADGNMPALMARAQELLDETRRRSELGARTADDASRQFVRVNEAKRLVERIRAALPSVEDDGERAAWEAQIYILDEEVAAAVEAVASAATPTEPRTTRERSPAANHHHHPADPGPRAAPNPERRPGAQSNGGRPGGDPPRPPNEPSPLASAANAGDMFAGLSVATPTPAFEPPTVPPRPASDFAHPPKGLDLENLFSGLDVSPAPPPLAPAPPDEQNTRKNKNTPPRAGVEPRADREARGARVHAVPPARGDRPRHA